MNDSEIQSQIEQVRQVRLETSRWRWGLTAAFAVITVISSGVLWCSANNLVQDGPPKQQFVTDLTEQMQNGVIPDATQIGREAISQIDFQGSMAKVNAKAPAVADAAMTQLQLLAKNLPDQGQQTLNAAFDSAIQERKAKLQAEFPQANDEAISTLMMGITSEAHSQVADLTDTLFNPHIETLNAIVADLNTIESKENPAKSEIPTWQMVFLVSDIARSDFAKLQADADAEKAKADKAEKAANDKAATMNKKKS